MTGLLLGVCAGLGELFLLVKLVQRLTGNKRGLAKLFFMKLALLFGTLLAAVFLCRAQLAWVGIGLAAPLVLGGIGISVRGWSAPVSCEKQTSEEGEG